MILPNPPSLPTNHHCLLFTLLVPHQKAILAPFLSSSSLPPALCSTKPDLPLPLCNLHCSILESFILVALFPQIPAAGAPGQKDLPLSNHEVATFALS